MKRFWVKEKSKIDNHSSLVDVCSLNLAIVASAFSVLARCPLVMPTTSSALHYLSSKIFRVQVLQQCALKVVVLRQDVSFS